jgi:TolB-like protein
VVLISDYVSVPSSIAGQQLGRYLVVEKIGAGGMGVVYRAHDQQLDRDVALKVLPPATLADKATRGRFHQEALAIAKLSHPNVAMAFDHGQEEGIDFIVTEYIPGTTLDEKLARGPLPEKTVLELGMQLSSGLEAAHEESIIHRDLKPSNLRVTNDGHLKILDFGLAKLIKPADGTESTVSLNQSLAFAGTLPYMAPEQLSGVAEDRRIDIWATGAVLYEMVTGKRAFPQKQNAELIDAIRYEDPIRPININPRVSSALETVILKALDKDPERRYQTARELRVDLTRTAAGNAAVGIRGPRVPEHSSKLPVRGILVALIIVLLIGMGTAFWGYRHFSKMEPERQQIMAVLPFDAVGQDAATSALGRGLTGTIAAKLVQASHVDRIQVVSPGDLREQGVKTADQARREFGTDFVLEGTIERSGEMIRINCYLVDSKTRRQLAARTITVAATDSFGLQDQVVSEVLALLPTQIKPEERRSLVTVPDTQPAAFESYIRGRGYLLEYEQLESIDRAIAEFERAIQIDPQCVRLRCTWTDILDWVRPVKQGQTMVRESIIQL